MMRTVLFGALGFLLGLAVAYGVAVIWNPSSYESTLPLLLAGAIAGSIVGILLAGHVAP